MARNTASQELEKVMTFRLSYGDASLVTAAATVGGSRDVSAFVRSAVVSQARRQLAAVIGVPEAGGTDHG